MKKIKSPDLFETDTKSIPYKVNDSFIVFSFFVIFSLNQKIFPQRTRDAAGVNSSDSSHQDLDEDEDFTKDNDFFTPRESMNMSRTSTLMNLLQEARYS